jgi:hypothetical protein
VKCDLINSGFVPNVEIPLWKPTNRLICLGTLSIVKQDFTFVNINSKTLSHQINNVTNDWICRYYLHDLQKKHLSLHKSLMCCQACTYIMFCAYNLVNPVIRNVVKSCFTIDNVPKQINRLVGFHSGISTLGTKRKGASFVGHANNIYIFSHW